MSKRTAVVTGGANGIGVAIVARLKRDGFHVIALDISVPGTGAGAPEDRKSVV